MKNIIIISGLLVAFLTFSSCGDSMSKNSTPSDVVKEMVKSIVDGDFDAFIALNFNETGKDLSEKEIEQTKAIMVLLKEDIEKKGGLKEIIVHEEKITEDGLKATVKMQLVYNDGKKAPEGNTKLIKVDGIWKIESL